MISEDSTLNSFRDSVRSFVSREVTPRVEEFIENRAVSRDLWRAAGDQGWFGIFVPEEYGGSAVNDWRYNAVLGEELARVSVGVNSCFAIHYDVVAPYLLELTTEEQKARWLPAFVSGEAVSAIGMTEPRGGSDLAAISTSAVRRGTDWIINGGKTFITNGYSAEYVVVAARTDPNARAGGVSLFMVEGGMPGFERGRKLDKVGQSESETAELFFTDVRVPAENLIGEVNRGFYAMVNLLPQERLSCAVSNISNAHQILLETIEYAKERKAFGQTIGSFQTMKHLLAEMVTEIDVGRSFVGTCIQRHVEGKLTAVDAAKAKWWTADVQNRILDRCVQVYGGYGYMKEYRVSRAWCDARVTSIWAGTNEIMKEMIGRDLGL